MDWMLDSSIVAMSLKCSIVNIFLYDPSLMLVLNVGSELHLNISSIYIFSATALANLENSYI